MLVVLLVFSLVNCNPDDFSDDGQQSKKQFDNLRDEVQYLIETNFSYGAVAVAVINGSDEFSIFHGTKTRGGNDPPDGDTLFLIGSVTKTFTAIVLAHLVVQATVGLEDEVQVHLPADRVRMPAYNGIPVRLIHLATHSSGLERNLAENYPLPPGTPDEDPFAMMMEENIYNYLTNYAVLQNEPGTVYSYSNFGFGLLGLVLGKVKHQPFKSLLKAVILDELDMNRSSFDLTDEAANNIAPGHNEYYVEVDPWSNDHDLVGCGGLNASLKDMTTYLKANMGIRPTQLRQAMDLSQQTHLGTDQGLGWYRLPLADGQIITCHGGASAGHRSFIGFNREYTIGVVILYNVSTGNRVVRDTAKKILEITRDY